ncbi:MAG: hypothetical protein KKH88_04770 [Nanoarchaeota archaeon]|nr:hypothetical protein [Nanoarchaeota archaeon]MBU1445263.1 hypothetical protein [Nanoarchaeota archaeon]MBU2420213.1 hypothetical protein [Nanoarchaeota archaeon]MBU2475059.1 hypothetical protein [Nanoarchaeota archaeon]MBU3941213.1 hypothetical protein [Nanoarchaeota archaeon]
MAVEELGLVAAKFLPLFIILIIWSTIWKGIALWKAGKNHNLVWFVFIFVLNTAGILPLIYVLFFSKKKGKKK